MKLEVLEQESRLPVYDAPLTPSRRRRSSLSFTSLSPAQRELEERLRTLCLLICAAGVCAYGLARLKFALVPLVLALSLKYLLQPMIDAMTGGDRSSEDDEDASSFSRRKEEEKKAPETMGEAQTETKMYRLRKALAMVALFLPRRCPRTFGFSGACFLRSGAFSRPPRYFWRPRLPHSVAVMIALFVAFSFLFTLAAIAAESVRDFTSRADAYARQVQLLIVQGLRWLDATGIDERWRKPQTLEKVADKLDLSSFVTTTVLSLGEGLLSLLSTTMLVLLFTLYLLLTPRLSPKPKNQDDDDDDDDDDDESSDETTVITVSGNNTFFPSSSAKKDTPVKKNTFDKNKPLMPPVMSSHSSMQDISSKKTPTDEDDKNNDQRSTFFFPQQRRRPSVQQGLSDRAVPQQQQQRLSPTKNREQNSFRQRSSFSKRVDRQINAYIKGKLALSLLVGLLTSAVLALLRVDLWLAFGVFSCFANFVPNLGAVVAVLLPTPVLFFDPDSTLFTAFLALASLIVLHALIGNVVEPILFGHSLKLHPVVCLVSMSIWGFIWGVPGLILAVIFFCGR